LSSNRYPLCRISNTSPPSSLTNTPYATETVPPIAEATSGSPHHLPNKYIVAIAASAAAISLLVLVAVLYYYLRRPRRQGGNAEKGLEQAPFVNRMNPTHYFPPVGHSSSIFRASPFFTSASSDAPAPHRARVDSADFYSPPVKTPERPSSRDSDEGAPSTIVFASTSILMDAPAPGRPKTSQSLVPFSNRFPSSSPNSVS
jgi:hypothetical protein